MLIVRFVVVLGLILVINATAGGMARPVGAVAVAGEAYALAAGTPPVVVGGSPSVTLPASGGTLTDATPGAGLGVGSGAGNADGLTASATGNADAGTVTSTAAIDLVELFGGVVRATDLRVTATASASRGGSGSSLTANSLTVGGLVYTDARPNTRVELPGLGYVVLNEQRVGGDGNGSGSASINAIHLWVTVPSALGVPAGTEIIVAHAAAGVPDLDANRAVASGPLPSATPVPWASLSPLAPIDISISDRNLGNGNDNVNFNSNLNNNSASAGAGAGAGAGATTTSRTTTPSSSSSASGTVVVTVVVVIVTPTLVPTTRPGPNCDEGCPKPTGR